MADWNQDGFDDLIFAGGQSEEAVIYTGGVDGLQAGRQQTLALEFMLHYAHGLDVADFDGDGKPDLASYGNTLQAGVGGSNGGPSAIFVRLQ